MTVHEQDIPDLEFRVTGARALPYAAVPTLAFRLAVARSGGGPVRAVTLTTAIRIAVGRRRYTPAEQASLAEVFGPPEQWSTSLRPLAWTQLTTSLPAFDDTTETDLPVPCSCDMELAVAKYLDAVRDGEVPLDFQFSGTVFHSGPDGRLRTTRISWSKETGYRLPARICHELTDRHFGGQRWLRLPRETYDRLGAHRARHALGGWDATVRSLLDRAADPLPSEPAEAPCTP